MMRVVLICLFALANASVIQDIDKEVVNNIETDGKVINVDEKAIAANNKALAEEIAENEQDVRVAKTDIENGQALNQEGEGMVLEGEDIQEDAHASLAECEKITKDNTNKLRDSRNKLRETQAEVDNTKRMLRRAKQLLSNDKALLQGGNQNESINTLMDILRPMAQAQSIGLSNSKKLTALLQAGDNDDDEGSSGGVGALLELIDNMIEEQDEVFFERQKKTIEVKSAAEQAIQRCVEQKKLANEEMGEATKTISDGEGRAGKGANQVTENQNEIAQLQEGIAHKKQAIRGAVEALGEHMHKYQKDKNDMNNAHKALTEQNAGFLQIRSNDDERRHQAIEIVRDLATKSQNTLLAQVSVRAGTMGLDKVRNMLESALKSVEKEHAGAEAEHNKCKVDKEAAGDAVEAAEVEHDAADAKLSGAKADQEKYNNQKKHTAKRLEEIHARAADVSEEANSDKAALLEQSTKLQDQIARITEAKKTINHEGLQELVGGFLQDKKDLLEGAKDASAKLQDELHKESQALAVEKAQTTAKNQGAEQALTLVADQVGEYGQDVELQANAVAQAKESQEAVMARCTVKPKSHAEKVQEMQDNIDGLHRALDILA